MTLEDLVCTREQGLKLQEIWPEWKPICNWYERLEYFHEVDRYKVWDASAASNMCIAVHYHKVCIAPTMQETLAKLPERIELETSNLDLVLYPDNKMAYCVVITKYRLGDVFDDFLSIVPATAQGLADLLIWIHQNYPQSLDK